MLVNFRSLLAILLLATSFLSSFGQNSTDPEIQQRTIYVTPEDSCPVDRCYRLEDVLRNSSYFFDSYTRLELLPGEYNIIEKVGQLVLVKVKNFTLKGLSPNVTIICQPGATWGLTIIKSVWVEISNVQIYNCSANLQLEGRNNTILMAYNEQVGRYLEYNLSSCDVNASKGYPACHVYLSIFKDREVTIHQTGIFYSRGVGIFSINNKGLKISKTMLAYNQINCMHYIIINIWFNTINTTLNMSHSQINFGQIKSYSLEFASGLNLFVHLNGHTHNISLTNITLTNNRGTHGNFYMSVKCVSTMVDMSILIRNISSIQTDTMIASPGMVIKYHIQLGTWDRTFNFFEQWWSIINPSVFKSLFTYDNDDTSNYTQHGRVHIVLQNGYFKGSCVMIRDSNLMLYFESSFRFEMNNIVTNESRCEAALSVVDSETIDFLSLSNLLIINSHNNILSVNIPNSHFSESEVILTGETHFLSNQGSISLLIGTIKFKDFVLISGNIAQEHESVFQVSDSSKVYFEGVITFVNNIGRQGGAISAYSSELYFEGNVSFIGNSAAENGGAISLKEGAVINLKNNTHVMFTGNVADTYGGAIYVEDSAFWTKRRMKCFLSISNTNKHYNVEFTNNTAGKAGADLYGGWIDLCEPKYYGIKRPSDILEFKTDNSIGSSPTRVCICTNSTPNKDKAEAHIAVFPGQTFEIEAVAVGQRFG